MKLDTLSPVIMQSARLTGQSVQRERKDEIDKALAQANLTDSAANLVQLAWKAANLEGKPMSLGAPRPNDCPFVGWHANHGWFVVVSQNADASWIAQSMNGASGHLKNLEGVECVSLPAKIDGERKG